MMNAISVRNLSKSYGTLLAVDKLSFEVKKGSLFAFLGENGAGKSTTISTLCGVLKKDRGEIELNGINLEEDPDGFKMQLGVVFQNSVLDRSLSVRENLESRAALYGLLGKEFEKRVLELAELLNFPDLLTRPVGKLSGGQRRRIDIARALLHRPSVLILDEPTTGLDPQTRKLMWQVLDEMRKQEGLTVFLTTHYMEEAAEADDVVILEKGRIAAQGTPLELKNRYAQDFVFLYGVGAEAACLGVPYEIVSGGVRIGVKKSGDVTEMILRHPELFFDFEITKGKMDDVFLAVTGRKAKEGEKE